MPAPFIMGWEEWLSLPDLGVPAIKAKVDTGARTSALHAHDIEPFGPIDAPLVRFTVAPRARRSDIEIACSAKIVDRRDVMSSNGESERRYVILTRVAMGEREWPIEMTLTNRSSMSYRMLLGRQAIMSDMFVDPASSFRQPKLSYKIYRKMPRRPDVRRALRIAILTRRPTAPSTARMAAAAAARGHVVETIDAAEVSLGFDGPEPHCIVRGERVPHFDAVIPRIGAGGDGFARAALRQLELAGSYTMNSADALERLGSALAVRQTLLRHGIASCGPDRVAAGDDTAPAPHARASERTRRVSVLVVGRQAAAVIAEDATGELVDAGPDCGEETRAAASKIARALDLRLALVRLAQTERGQVFASVGTIPALNRIAKATDTDIAGLVIADIEAERRAWSRNIARPHEPPLDAAEEHTETAGD